MNEQAIVQFIFVFFPSIIVLIGLVMVIKGITSYLHKRQVVKHKIEVVGELLRYEEHRRRKQVRYSPVISFVLPDGSEGEFVGRVSLNEKDWPEGTQVPVLVDPKDPERSLIRDWWQIWFWPVFHLSIGGITLGIGLWVGITFLQWLGWI